jgi:hypothetical protein
MHNTRPLEDPARRWQQFCRTGWRMAWMFAALWFGALALLFRLAPAPGPAPLPVSAPVSWWPAQSRAAMDIRALWSSAAFALPTPAGFSHSLRDERVRLAPPVQAARPAAAFLDRPPPPVAFDLSKPGGRLRLAPADTPPAMAPAVSVFPPRAPERDAPRMNFPEGWESRLFSGIDLNFGAWTNVAWSAQVEMCFDERGVPASMLVAQSSGIPEVDRRLARSANAWRLLEPGAARTGVVAWSSPAPAAPEPAAGAAGGRGAP